MSTLQQTILGMAQDWTTLAECDRVIEIAEARKRELAQPDWEGPHDACNCARCENDRLGGNFTAGHVGYTEDF